MKRIISLTLILLVVQILTPAFAYADNIDSPTIYPSPIISWGNSSYHDSLGARDPFVVKDQGNYYLYYDCTEDLLNPSFESNLGANGWDTYEAQITTSTTEHLFGQQSLQVTTSNKGSAGLLFGAFTGNYYFQSIKDDAHLAVPTGLEVTPNTIYIASAYVKAPVYASVGLTVVEYTDDPGYWNNHIEPIPNKVAVWGNDNWQRLVVKFTTLPSTKAITISLVVNGNTTTYWDGVQLERVEASVDDPSPFPTDQNYNHLLEDTIGWRSCLATSSDGINFQKKGQISIIGTRGVWETKEKPGWVGSSGMYLSPFFYQGYWYSYTWVAGYELGTDIYTQDQGSQNHRQWYGDRRAFLPNGNPTRSGLVRSTSLLGPFERVSQAGPQVLPNSSWGQTYVSANGVPQRINDTWVLFLAGEAVDNQWRTITPGLAIGDSPLGSWTVADYSPLLPPNYQNEVPEGPIYYLDRSGTHFMFINNIGGNSSVDAYWTDNPLTKWLPANKKTVVSGSQLGGAAIGLPTVVEKDNNTLLVYFATRPPSPSDSWRQYLFHNIGLATFDLPLVASVNLQGDLNSDNTVNRQDYDILVANFGNTTCGNAADIESNCIVDIFDYNVLVGNFGK